MDSRVAHGGDGLDGRYGARSVRYGARAGPGHAPGPDPSVAGTAGGATEHHSPGDRRRTEGRGERGSDGDHGEGEEGAASGGGDHRQEASRDRQKGRRGSHVEGRSDG